MASFFQSGEQVHIIANTWSIFHAGFHAVKSYYNKNGDRLTYYIHDDGTVLERFSRRRRQPFNNFYHSKDEANAHFKKMNHGQTFETGKWIPEKIQPANRF